MQYWGYFNEFFPQIPFSNLTQTSLALSRPAFLLYHLFFQFLPQNSKHKQKTKTTVEILQKNSAVLSNTKFQPVELQAWSHVNYKLAVASNLHFQSYGSRTWGCLNINFFTVSQSNRILSRAWVSSILVSRTVSLVHSTVEAPFITYFKFLNFC